MDTKKTCLERFNCKTLWRKIMATGWTKPGVGQAPASYSYAKDRFLQDSVGIQRYPKNDSEWRSFIHELGNYIKNENGFWTPTFYGFSADPSSPICIWHRYGQLVEIKFVFTTGTSDQTGFIILNVPEVIRPSRNNTGAAATYALTGGLEDNGTPITTPCSVQIDSTGALAFYTDAHFGSWAGLGQKGFTDGADNPSSILYMLSDPVKR